jgi:hypothetical protein
MEQKSWREAIFLDYGAAIDDINLLEKMIKWYYLAESPLFKVLFTYAFAHLFRKSNLN